MMNRLEAAARQALEALEHSHANEPIWKTPHRNAAAALREALAEQQAAEPVDKVAIMQRIVDSQTGHTRTVAREPEQEPTCKQHLQVWVIPKGKGRGQFSWEPQDERFWTRMEPAVKQSLTAQPEPAQQAAEPVALLANGTRFKISYDSRQSGGKIHGIPPELSGRWVALVAAEDDCHLKFIHPAPAQQPLTDEQIWEAYMKAPVDIDCHVSDLHKFARAIEAAHHITGSKEGGAA